MSLAGLLHLPRLATRAISRGPSRYTSRAFQRHYYHRRSLATVMESSASRSAVNANDIRVLATQVEKPEIDDRSYKVIELPNKLRALLVHDPTTDFASAAMDVNVGHLSDPADFPGLAHFCGML